MGAITNPSGSEERSNVSTNRANMKNNRSWDDDTQMMRCLQYDDPRQTGEEEETEVMRNRKEETCVGLWTKKSGGRWIYG